MMNTEETIIQDEQDNQQINATSSSAHQSDTFSSLTSKQIGKQRQSSLNKGETTNELNIRGQQQQQQPKSQRNSTTVGRFISIYLNGSIETGYFNSVNDVYIKYSIVAGPDWILSTGTDVGVTQIARYKLDENDARKFVWNQPITIGYRSYNFFGWPQIVLSVYYFDKLGNDQILGYGCVHLPISSTTPSNFKQEVKIYAPQSSSLLRQILCWVTGRKPELVDSNLIARSDCRSALQMVCSGKVNLSINLITKDVAANGYKH